MSLSVISFICATPSLKLSQFRMWYTHESGLPLKSADFLENISAFQIRELLMIFVLLLMTFPTRIQNSHLFYHQSKGRKNSILTFFFSLELNKQNNGEEELFI